MRHSQLTLSDEFEPGTKLLPNCLAEVKQRRSAFHAMSFFSVPMRMEQFVPKIVFWSAQRKTIVRR